MLLHVVCVGLWTIDLGADLLMCTFAHSCERLSIWTNLRVIYQSSQEYPASAIYVSLDRNSARLDAFRSAYFDNLASPTGGLACIGFAYANNDFSTLGCFLLKAL